MSTPQTRTVTEYDHSLDARGLNCPLPVLKTKVQLTRMQSGEVLYVQATDPHSVIDFEAYCARSGHELIGKNETGDGVFEFYIRRAANASTHI